MCRVADVKVEIWKIWNNNKLTESVLQDENWNYNEALYLKAVFVRICESRGCDHVRRYTSVNFG